MEHFLDYILAGGTIAGYGSISVWYLLGAEALMK